MAKQTMCDKCKKVIERPKHIFTLEAYDVNAYREKTINADLCVECHDAVKKFIAGR
jgi:hypothetical protein